MVTKLIIFDLDDTLMDTTGNIKTENVKKSFVQKNKNKNKIVPFPEAENILNNLSAIKILVTRESGDDQQKKIDLLGIRHHFEDILVCYSNEEKRNCFQNIIERYANHEIWVVGDRIDAEIRYGNEFGFKTVWIRQGKYKDAKAKDGLEIPDYKIMNLSALWEII